MQDVDQPTLAKLLDLQEQDSAVKRLQERRAALPEAAELAQLEARSEELASDIGIATKQNDDIGSQHSRLEGEIELLEGKIGKEEQRMFSGSVSNPKELSSLQAEVESLKRKRSGLEDELLEVMEARESSSATLERLTAERNEISSKAEALTATVAELTGGIDSELKERSARRDEIAAEIPDDLLSLYDKIREQKAGVGAAALDAGTCQGCHTKLPQREFERIRAEQGLQRCDNCRRILVVV